MPSFVRTIRKAGDLLTISLPKELHELYPDGKKVQVTVEELKENEE